MTLLFRSPRKYYQNLFRDLAKIYWSSHRPRCLLSYRCIHLILNIFFSFHFFFLNWISLLFLLSVLNHPSSQRREAPWTTLSARKPGQKFADYRYGKPWWRHQMETFSALLAICAGNSPVPGEFPAQRPITRSFDVSFDLRPHKQLSKQWWGWWYETLSCPLWRHGIANRVVCFSVTALPFACEANINAYDTLFNQLTLPGKLLSCKFVALIQLIYVFFCHRG